MDKDTLILSSFRNMVSTISAILGTNFIDSTLTINGRTFHNDHD